MALRQRDESLAAQWVRIRELTTTGRLEQALKRAGRLIATASDPLQAAQAQIARAIVLYNTAGRQALLPLLKPIEDRLHAADHPRLVAEYHLLAAAVAYDARSYDVGLLHLVKAQRALERMGERTRAAVYAWGDLAAIYTRLGYHVQALEAGKRAEAVSADVGQPAATGMASVASVHAAVYLDQRGDTDGCVCELADLVARSRPHVGALDLPNVVGLGYAVRRLAVLDHRVSLDLPAAREVGPLLSQINTLGDVCDALAARRPDDALARLDAVSEPLDALGVAEPLRLRSLALSQRGDHAGALATERCVLLVSSQEECELRALLADSAGVRIDQDELRRTAERHARAALTDPLTGLPNRRGLDEFMTALTTERKTAAVGMLDLDRFKEINDTHGHPTGDVVLQRVAGVLAREVRPTDLLARSGGDEFTIVLPDMATGDAEAMGERIETAVRNEDWSGVAPDTPVEVSTGWAGLDSDVDGAFRAADNALYETKRRHHDRS